MKIRTTSNAPGYVRIFQRAFVASAIATFLGACAGGTGEETGNGATTEATPGLGAAVEVSEGGQTGIDVDSTTDTTEIPEVDSTNSIPDNPLGLIQSHPDLGLFATAIRSSGLVNYLADPEQRVTVFALSDKAFESLSSIQRDALFNDPARLDKLVRATTIPDARIAASAAGVVGDLKALNNGTLNFESEGDSITLTHQVSYYRSLDEVVEVMGTIANDEAAIHIIDDFINTGTTFFPPDPGSIMDKLLEDGATTFTDRLGVTQWFRDLGNSERGWTVFEPAGGRVIDGTSLDRFGDLESHIVAHDLDDPITIKSGSLTSVDELSHVIKDVAGALTIDDIEISELNAFQANNGHVHRIVWPLGEYMSVLNLVEQYADSDYGTSGIDFFAKLIRSLDETERYNDRGNRITLVIPEYGITRTEWYQTDLNYGDYRDITTIYDVYSSMRANESFAMVPDIFPDTDTARTFLLSHTIAGVVTEETLENGVGSYLQTATGTSLAITGTTSEGSTDDRYLGGQSISPGTESMPAANGAIVSTLTALADTPNFSGVSRIPDSSTPTDSAGTIQATLEGAGNYNTFLGLGFLDSYETNSWTVFAPTDEAIASAGTTPNIQDLIAPQYALSAADLLAAGSITTNQGKEYAVSGTEDALLIDGKAAALVATGATGTLVYSLDSILE